MSTPTVLVTDERGEHVAVQRIRLLEVDGPRIESGAVFTATSERVTIGSADGCDVVLRDRTVSRHHAELTVRDGRVAITDLGSSNGTTVDGVRVERAFVSHGHVIGLGRAKLRFELADNPVCLPVSSQSRFGGLVGAAPASRAAFALLERAAAGDATVLLSGETGTGKEAAAHAVHEASARAARPFVVVDCASIPPELLESELFGHARGAFTGAVVDRTGAFAAADGGTIFLDEIGELPLALQPKLLRALEAREVKPIGRTDYVPIDVRVVAATHRDLAAEVGAGRFRADLYYRLAVIAVRIPALRDRLDDLPLVVVALLDELGVAGEPAAVVRAPAALAGLARHAWPGNVRELRNHLERAIGMGGLAPPLPPAGSIAAHIDITIPLRDARERWTREHARRYVTALLEAHGGNVTAAARAAGVDRSHLHRLIAKLDRDA